MVVTSEEAVDSLLHAIGRRAQKACKPRVAFLLPPDSPVARRLLVHYEGENPALAPKNSGGMARLIGLESTLSKIAWDLSRRVVGSRFRDWSGPLVIDSDIGAVTLVFEPGRVSVKPGVAPAPPASVIKVYQQALTRLIPGYEVLQRSPKDYNG